MLLVRESINSGLLFDFAKLDAEIEELTKVSESDNFWSNNSEALKVISRLNYCKDIILENQISIREIASLNTVCYTIRPESIMIKY